MDRRSWKRFVSVAAVLMFVLAAGVAPAQEEYPGRDVSAGTVLLDLAFVRPLGMFAMVLGSAALVVSLPFSLPTGSVDEAAQMLVVAPTLYTFKRPVGQLD